MGRVTEQSIEFQGIPYAVPPIGRILPFSLYTYIYFLILLSIGTLRWQHPQPVVPWQPVILNATHYPFVI